MSARSMAMVKMVDTIKLDIGSYFFVLTSNFKLAQVRLVGLYAVLVAELVADVARLARDLAGTRHVAGLVERDAELAQHARPVEINGTSPHLRQAIGQRRQHLCGGADSAPGRARRSTSTFH